IALRIGGIGQPEPVLPVRLTQGDTILECKTLVVYYEDESTKAKPGGKPASKPAVATPMGQGGDQKISKLVAKGGVVLTQKDQTATGDNGIYDMKSNTMVMTGNVTLTQGQNVVRGDKLFVDLNTNISRVESTRKAGESRVQGLFLPNSPDTKKPGAEADPSSRAPAASNGAVRTQNSERDRAPPRSLR
ncbi:MAG: hypothetical protein J0H62_02805, partial [Rhizobiales bacterium]|nr:hypothetical protein [Hyphomicrobiales bacterium]